MNAYRTFTQPWRSAIAVWTVMAQAQTEFALRAMGMTTRRMAARRSSLVSGPAVVPAAAAPVALLEAVVQAAPEPVAEPVPSAEVVPLRLVTDAGASVIGTATTPEVLPEAEAEAAPFVVAEEPAEVALAVLAEPAEAEDLVQAAIRPLVAVAEGVEEAPADLADLLPGTVPATSPARRTASGSRRSGKAKRTS